MDNVMMEKLLSLLVIFPVLLLSVAIHEFAHCWTTDRLGDDTPRQLGRVTLNPLAHLDPLGTVMMFVTSWAGFGFGWGKASPFNPANFRYPARDRMLTAVAGPISNLLQMLCWASLGHLLTPWLPDSASVVLTICLYGVIINAALAAFNLLPIYPLDGHHLLSYVAPRSWRPIIDNPVWGIVFLVLVLGGATRYVVWPVINGMLTVTQVLVSWPPPHTIP